MSLYQNLITKSLIAAVANGISLSQSLASAGNLTTTGSLVTSTNTSATINIVASGGLITSGNVPPGSGGTGYFVGQIITVSGGGGTNGTFNVVQTFNGAITIVSLNTAGTGYTTISNAATTTSYATLDTPRRVIITSAGNDSGITFTVTGTGANGLLLSEVVTGANAGAAATNHDFATVFKISGSAATASTVTAGTNSTGSSVPVIMDTIVNPATYGAAVLITGTVTYSVEISYDDFGPLFDLNANTATWFSASGFASQTTSQSGTISGPCTMIRLTVNSGTGTASLKLIKPLIAGPY